MTSPKFFDAHINDDQALAGDVSIAIVFFAYSVCIHVAVHLHISLQYCKQILNYFYRRLHSDMHIIVL